MMIANPQRVGAGWQVLAEHLMQEDLGNSCPAAVVDQEVQSSRHADMDCHNADPDQKLLLQQED
jgi:hypothetical protein